jgi:hypothetical protein
VVGVGGPGLGLGPTAGACVLADLVLLFFDEDGAAAADETRDENS